MAGFEVFIDGRFWVFTEVSLATGRIDEERTKVMEGTNALHSL